MRSTGLVHQSPAGEHLAQELRRAVVGIVRRDHPVAGRERLENRVRSRHPRRECRRGRAAFERGEALLEHPPVRIGVPDVHEAAREAAVRRALERRREVDRRADRAGGGVGGVPGVYGEGLESHGSSEGRGRPRTGRQNRRPMSWPKQHHERHGADRRAAPASSHDHRHDAATGPARGRGPAEVLVEQGEVLRVGLPDEVEQIAESGDGAERRYPRRC